MISQLDFFPLHFSVQDALKPFLCSAKKVITHLLQSHLSNICNLIKMVKELLVKNAASLLRYGK